MRRLVRTRFTRAIVIWSACLVLLAVVIAAEATWSLIRADEACFVAYPSTPCPTVGDPALTRLTFAFIGVPLIWFVGMAAAFVGRELGRRRVPGSGAR